MTKGRKCSLSLVDLSMRPMTPDGNILSVRTTCTNRDLPSRLPFGLEEGDFELEGASALKKIVALRKPTPPVRPPTGKSALWRLISHLSLNYLSLVEEGREAFQQILRLYDIGRTAYSQNVIDSVVKLRAVDSLRRCARITGRHSLAEFASRWSWMKISSSVRSIPVCQRGGAVSGLSASLNSFVPAVGRDVATKRISA